MTEREIAEVLRAVPLMTTGCPCPDHGDPHDTEALYPDYDAMVRAIVEQIVGPLATVCQRHGCMWEAHEHCEEALADRDARLARLVEAASRLHDDVFKNIVDSDAHFANWEALRVALADVGVGKEAV